MPVVVVVAGNVEQAAVWAVDWHPVGHLLVTGSNDKSVRFWSRSRPGEHHLIASAAAAAAADADAADSDATMHEWNNPRIFCELL